MRHFLFRKSIGLIAFSLFFLYSTVSALVYPAGAPSGEILGGQYRLYFDNMFPGCTTPGQVITGFSLTGIPNCISPASTSLSIYAQTGYTLFYNGSAWTGSANIYNNNGNVGIGTSTPGAKLEINGQIKITGGTPGAGKFLISDATGLASWVTTTTALSGTYWSLAGNNPSGTNFLGTLGTEDLIFKTNSLERMRITGGGNILGLGADTPLGTSTNNFIVGNLGGYNLGGQYNTVLGGYGGGYQMGGYYNTALGTYAGYAMSGMSNIAMGTYAGTSMSTGNNNLYLGSYASGVLARDHQFSIGNVLYGQGMGTGGLTSGRVGIGTMNPSYKLQVIGTGSFSSVRITDGAASGRVLRSDPTGNAYWSDGAMATVTNVGNIIGGVENYVPKFGSGGDGLVLGLLYDDGVTLGVGTSTPNNDYVLHTSGSILIGDDTVFSDTLFESFEGVFAPAGWTISAGAITVTRDTTERSEGTASVKFTGGGANNSTASISYTINVAYNSLLSFDWKTSSEPGGDILAFCLDALPCDINVSGITSWKRTTYNLSPGIHTLKWQYSKDPAAANGLDSAWLDRVQIRKFGPTYLIGGHMGIDIPVPKYPLDVSGYIQSHGFCIDNRCGDSWRRISELGTSTGGYNTYLGGWSLGMLTSGTNNFAAGPFALGQNTIGSNNTAIGVNALVYNTSGSNNMAIGYLSLFRSTTASNNIALGNNALQNNTTGANNIALGYNAADSLTTGSNNIVIGYNIDTPSTTSSNTLNIGNLIFANGVNGSNTTLSTGNVGIGVSNPGQKLTISGGTIQIINGSQGSGKVLVSDANGVASWGSGGTSANLITGGTPNYLSKFSATGGLIISSVYESGSFLAIGSTGAQSRFEVWSGSSILFHTRGTNNLGIGIGSVRPGLTGNANTAVGNESLFTLTTGYSNSAFGHMALRQNTTGFNNTAIGKESMYNNGNGTWNTAVGYQSLRSATSPGYNTALGGQALYSIATGSGNTAVGHTALYSANFAASNNTALGYRAGAGIESGWGNVMIGYDVQPTSSGANHELNIGNWIYGRDGNIGIGTNNPLFRFEIDSGVADTSGMRFTRLNSNSPLTSNGIVSIGVNGSGEVVAVSPISNIAVYLGVDRSTPLSPDPDLNNFQITYDFNRFFAIPGRQSFVVSNGSSASKSGPYFKENGTSSLCSVTGSIYDCADPDPVTGISASPYNSFTMSAKGDVFGYQIALGARGDAPLFARSGRFGAAGMTGGLFLNDGTSTPAPWQKVISVPANHPEYFYINTGFNSQLQPQNGGGSIGIGTTFPQSRFEVWTGASTDPLLHFRGRDNVAVGLAALDITATGTLSSIANTSIGAYTLSNNTSGSGNTALGYRSLFENTTGQRNVALGVESLGNSRTGNDNIGIGYQAGRATTSIAVSGNIAIGYQTLFSTTSSNLTAIGYQTLMNNTSGVENTALGYQSLMSSTTARSNTAVGYESMRSNTLGSNNVALGYRSLRANTTGANSTAIGYQALFSSTATGNTAIGASSLLSNTTGGENIAFGVSTLASNTSGSRNALVGNYAGMNLTTQSDNAGLGYESMRYMQSANNTALGAYSLRGGNSTSPATNNGSNNIALGYASLRGTLGTATTGSNNVSLGGSGLLVLTSGSNNVALGNLAGSSITTGSNNILIGYNAQSSSATASNRLNIGNWIYGNGGNIGVGTSSPSTKLDIDGQIRIRGGNPGAGKILMSDGTGLATWQNPSGSAIIPWSIVGNSGTTTTSNFLGTTDAVDLAVRTNNVERMRILSNGRIGIGTNNPGTYTLSVSGTTFFSQAVDVGSGRSITFQNPGLANSAGLIWNLPSDSASLYVRENTSDQSDYIFRLGNDTTGDRFVWWIDTTGTDVYPMRLAGNYGDFYSGAIYIDNSVSGGRIGFGTTSPSSSSRVDVNGQIRISGGNPGNGKVLVSDAAGLASWQPLAAASGALNTWSTFGNSGTLANTNFLGTTDNIPLVLRTNNVERMRIATDGNIFVNGITFGRGSGSVVSNTVAGFGSLRSNTTGSNTSAFGYQSLRSQTTGANNTALGYDAGNNLTTGSNNIAIGSNTPFASSTASNQLNIGNWIYGNGGNIGVGTSSPGQKLTVSGGTLQIINGSQGSGKILTSDANGIATWQLPASSQRNTYIYRMETSQSTTSTTASTVASLTSEELPIGPYQFEVIGKFRSDNGSNGIGMTLSQINGSSNQFIGSVSAQLTSTTQSETSFVSPGTLVVSNSVPNANTDYAVLMKGTFNITSAGSVAVQFSSENNGRQITLQPGTVLIIRSLDPGIAGGGI